MCVEWLPTNLEVRIKMNSELSIGDVAPEFEAVADTGETVRLSDFRGRRVVLYFYPKDDTPGCTTQACGFRDHYADIEERDATVLGVSPDGKASHQKFKSKYDLPFTLLVDDDHSIAELYGVWGEKKMYGKTYMGVIRSHYVIDEDGKIADIKFNVRPADSVDLAIKTLGNLGN
jgi:peroxiredoxin Q/BCP